jgi:hypothetical protein
LSSTFIETYLNIHAAASRATGIKIDKNRFGLAQVPKLLSFSVLTFIK